jgi:RNA polymerase sigma factor (sigma-70 family)
MAKSAAGSITQQQLVEGCIAGKPALQRSLYDLYAGRMLAVCKRYASDIMEAEDTLHTAFVKVFTRMDSFRGGSLEGWIRTICIREAINAYNARKRSPITFSEDLPNSEEIPAQALAELNMQDLARLIAALPDGARIVFTLYAIDGYDHAHIADTLGISVGTSKSQLSRARKLLQNKLVATEK